MQKMELRIQVNEEQSNAKPKYEVYVPLTYSDKKILEVMKHWLKDIRATEAGTA
jgi:uncharacterized protein YpbB